MLQKICKETENPINCVICLEEIEEMASIDCCNHCFDFGCIEQWAKVTNLCPLCKQAFRAIIFQGKSIEVENKIQPSVHPEDEDRQFMEAFEIASRTFRSTRARRRRFANEQGRRVIKFDFSLSFFYFPFLTVANDFG